MTYSRIDFAGRAYAPCGRQQSTGNTPRADAVSMRVRVHGQGIGHSTVCERTEPKEENRQARAAKRLRTGTR